MSAGKIKLLYLAGCGRSGSTILHNALHQIDEFCAVGELRHLWERGFLKNKLCGCGVHFRDCPFWSQVAAEALGGMDFANAEGMRRFADRFRMHHLAATLLPGGKGRWQAQAHEYLDAMQAVYKAIQAVSGCRVIVDSSKNPAFGWMLTAMDSLDLHVVHLIRDPRAVAHSWSTKKLFELDDGRPEYMARKRPVVGAAQWLARNLGTAAFVRVPRSRYLRIYYEDFIADPRRCLEDILRLVDERDASLDFVSGSSVDLRIANHSVFGNLVRFQTGVVPLRVDDRWRREMSRGNRIAVSALTLPWLARFGYLRSRGAARPPAQAPAPAETPMG